MSKILSVFIGFMLSFQFPDNNVNDKSCESNLNVFDVRNKLEKEDHFFGESVSLGINNQGIHTLEQESEVMLADDFSRLDGQVWKKIGRGEVSINNGVLRVKDCFVKAGEEEWKDYEMSFSARAPEKAEQVQIWSGFRCHDRDNRYLLGLRGGNHDDLYLAWYSPRGKDEFLAIEPLDFHPIPGTWYDFRIVVQGSAIKVYLNDESSPRINVIHDNTFFQGGGILLGGGWIETEFDHVRVIRVNPADDATAAPSGSGKNNIQPVSDHPTDGLKSDSHSEKEQQREEQRDTYKAQSISGFTAQRSEYSLDGNWLFLPDYEWPEQTDLADPSQSDAKWHVIDVPNFWNPLRNWLHGETGGMRSGDKGASDNFFQLESARAANYTFNSEKTNAAWYRHHIVLPENIGDRHFELCLDAIAKVSELWVNGQLAGKHIGMFGEVRVDVTPFVRPGNNLIAVKVLRNYIEPLAGADEIMGVAISMEITRAMLNDLPHAIYRGDPGGIWQPVKLIVTRPVRVRDIFARVRLDGADFDMTVSNLSGERKEIDILMEIEPVGGGEKIFISDKPQKVIIDAGEEASLTLNTGVISPKPWSPHEPNLYHIRVILSSGGVVLDNHVTETGFRTFEVRGSKLYLNGKPFWLRGGNHSPMAVRPNDKELAYKYTRLHKEGNMNINRTVCSPYNTLWLEASDRIGVAVSYEGTWPWLMLIDNPIPDQQLIEIWKKEFSSLIRKYRNHPSIFMWTINNEMKFGFADRDTERRNEKWRILTDMIKIVRAMDPTRPVIFDSSHMRRPALPRPEWADDGDIDDLHAYNGWYQPSFFHLYNKDYLEMGYALPDRPFISQEFSTGYPNNDSGHATRFYLFKHLNPQSLVGDYAYEHHNPMHFLNRHAFITKELAETLRRYNRRAAAGFMHFASVSWFKDVYDTERIEAYPAYYAIQRALQPVLVSAELFGRHYYAGSSLKGRVCVINDSEDCTDLPETILYWEIRCESEVLSSGMQKVDPVAYYDNHWLDVEFRMPVDLPSPKTEAQLVLKLSGNGRLYSENTYDITLTTHAWANQGISLQGRRIGVFGADEKITASLRESGCELVTVMSLNELDNAKFDALFVHGLGTEKPTGYLRIKDFADKGGRVLLSQNHTHVKELLPEQVISFSSNKHGEEIVTMNIPESPVFDGIEPGDMSWFGVTEPKIPAAAAGFFDIKRNRPDVYELAETCRIHGYLEAGKEFEGMGSTIFEVKTGKGRILISEMLIDAGEIDPIARRLMTNMLSSLFNEN